MVGCHKGSLGKAFFSVKMKTCLLTEKREGGRDLHHTLDVDDL